MEEIVRATSDDAVRIADLYAKAFEKTGLKKFAAPEKRAELVAWLKALCGEGKIWYRSDDAGPVVLGHYDADKDEVITVVTRDGAEQAGHATAMLNGLVALFPSANARPVTRGGKALAKKCGFLPSPSDQSLWVRDRT